MSRRLPLLPVAAAAAFALSAGPAEAMSPQLIPSASSPAVLPGTTRAVDEWKLVGRGSASGTQIAPQWVLSADHSSIPVGQTFTTPYGSATVTQKFEPPFGYDVGGVDLTLHLLSSPINAPSFPKLLSEYPSYALLPSLPGSLLNTGFGGAPAETPTIGWTAPAGGPVAGATTAPTAIGGDSGGAQYWYPSATGPAVLANILVWGNSPALDNQQPVASFPADEQEDAAGWIQGVVNGVPSVAKPEFTTIAEAAGPLSSFRPAPVGNVVLASGGASSVKIRWTNPAANGVPRTGAKIFVNGVLKQTVSATATTATLSGLSWLTNYTARVVSTNANGEAYPAPYGGDTVAFKTRWLF